MDGIETSAELLTVAEVAARLRVKTSWVYQHAAELGTLHVGKYLRFQWHVVLEQLGDGAIRYPHLSRTWDAGLKASHSIAGIQKAITRRTIVAGPAGQYRQQIDDATTRTKSSRSCRKRRNRAGHVAQRK